MAQGKLIAAVSDASAYISSSRNLNRPFNCVTWRSVNNPQRTGHNRLVVAKKLGGKVGLLQEEQTDECSAQILR